jgi:hypothetical protein
MYYITVTVNVLNVSLTFAGLLQGGFFYEGYYKGIQTNAHNPISFSSDVLKLTEDDFSTVRSSETPSLPPQP